MIEQATALSPLVPFDPLRWPLIFTLLSMDVVVPFYDLMGLRVSAPTALRDLLRAEILEVRREYAVAPEGGAIYSPERTLARISRAAQREHVVWWGQRVFNVDSQEHRSLGLWNNLLRFCAQEAERWQKLRLPARLAVTAHQEFVQTISITPYYDLNLEVYAKPLSDWDLHMYAVALFNDDDVACHSPDKYVYGTFRNYQNYRFWAWILKQTTAQEQEALMQNATALAKQEELLRYVGSLVPPSHLEIGL